MNFKSSVIAAAIAVASTSSFAGALTLVPDGYGSLTTNVDGTLDGETFTFFANAGDSLDLLSITSTYTTRKNGATWDQTNGFHVTSIDFNLGLSVGANTPTIKIVNATTKNNYDSWEFGTLIATTGTQTITVHGIGVGTDHKFSGTLTITPVPEPETYALMLAGLGAVGFISRRRKAA